MGLEIELPSPELRNFLDSVGRVKVYPSKRKNQALVVEYLATKFEPGKLYTEKQVNELLMAWHVFEDWALLRRELFDLGFLDRSPDGASYWRVSDSS